MNPSSEPVRWTPRRWLSAIAIAFAIQATIVLAFGRRSKPPAETPRFPTAIQLVLGDPRTNLLWTLAGLEDPLVLALPTLRGFSRQAWLEFEPLRYQPAEASENTTWFELSNPALGSAFTDYVKSNRLPPELIAEKPFPPLVRYEPRFPAEPARIESSLRTEGALAQRSLANPIPLRSWVHSEMLSNTVVQIAVNADGITFSPVLLAESGSAQVDSYALKIASEARFSPLPHEPRQPGRESTLTWGRLVFRWHTVAPTGTNLPTNPP